MKSITELSKLLGEENAEQLKKNITELIIDRVKDDLESSNEYLFCPSDCQEFVNEVFEECKAEIKVIIKEKILADAMKKLEG